MPEPFRIPGGGVIRHSTKAIVPTSTADLPDFDPELDNFEEDAIQSLPSSDSSQHDTQNNSLQGNPDAGNARPEKRPRDTNNDGDPETQPDAKKQDRGTAPDKHNKENDESQYYAFKGLRRALEDAGLPEDTDISEIVDEEELAELIEDEIHAEYAARTLVRTGNFHQPHIRWQYEHKLTE